MWNSLDTTRIFLMFFVHQTVNWVDVCVQVWNTSGVFPFIWSAQLWGWLISSSLMHHLQWWKVFWCVLDLIIFLNMDINTVSTSFIFRSRELLCYFCIPLIFCVLKFEIYSTTEHSGYWLLFLWLFQCVWFKQCFF